MGEELELGVVVGDRVEDWRKTKTAASKAAVNRGGLVFFYFTKCKFSSLCTTMSMALPNRTLKTQY